MAVPNAHAVQRPPAPINPTGNGPTFAGQPNGPDTALSASPQTGNGVTSATVPNAPNGQLPTDNPQKINWTLQGPIVRSSVLQTSPAASSASVLAADGSVVAGTPPPYVGPTVVIPA